MRFTPYLNFDGQCKEAFTFYQQVFGGTLLAMQTHGDSPIAGEVPSEWHERVLHACLLVGDSMVMASDSPPGSHEPVRGLYISVHIDDPAEAERVFEALAEKGTVTMPMEKTFWAERFGMLTDRYGTPWMINGGSAS